MVGQIFPIMHLLFEPRVVFYLSKHLPGDIIIEYPLLLDIIDIFDPVKQLIDQVDRIAMVT